jgi:hypothetical protein
MQQKEDQVPFKTKQMVAESNTRTPRSIVGQTRFDHVRSQNIRRQCNVQGIGEWIRRRRDEWNEHVSRMAPESIVRSVGDNSPTPRHPSSRVTHILGTTG